MVVMLHGLVTGLRWLARTVGLSGDIQVVAVLVGTAFVV